MNETQAHLANNGGVRAHSADMAFSLNGITKFCYIRKGKIVRMERHPNGRESLRHSTFNTCTSVIRASL